MPTPSARTVPLGENMSQGAVAGVVRDDRRGRRAVLWSYWILVGVPVGLVWSVIWAVRVDTSPTLADDERIRGWGTVVRELPATVPLVLVPIVGLVIAVRAGRAGSTDGASRAIWLHGAALFFVLLVVMNGSAENIMTTRPATVKWLLLPSQVLIAGLSVWGARRAANVAAGSPSAG